MDLPGQRISTREGGGGVRAHQSQAQDGVRGPPRKAGSCRLLTPVFWLPSLQPEDSLIAGEEQGIALSPGKEVDGPVGLPLVRFETERQLGIGLIKLAPGLRPEPPGCQRRLGGVQRGIQPRATLGP